MFAHWQIVFSHPQGNLDDKRKDLIRNALKMGYSVAQLKLAIDGCSRTPHNVGLNDRNQVYDGIQIVFRDADQIDRFIRNSSLPMPTRRTTKDRLLDSSWETDQGKDL